ncbi:porin family protein [Jejudonia soesokkakensis]|uniref:Porin family protein n=1 Tax=Jejudonia soesokkakensis TaxID=1323432 RepID=A0ABW2MSW5_9FLAO
MKKLFLFTAMAVFGFTTTQAQVMFGAKAGANFASITGSDVNDVDGRTDFHVGALANIGINEWFAIQPEVVYSAQGFSFDDEADVEQSISYLNIPIMADFTIAEGLSLQGGPQVGIKVGSKFKVDGDDIDEDDDGIESLDIATGIGAQYKLPTLGLFFQARYMIGFTDIIEDVDASNSVVSVSVGWFFD